MNNQYSRPEGNFSFVPAHGTYCRDVLPHSGYQVAHSTFVNPMPLDLGFDTIATHLKRLGRPIQALCGMELRIPNALGFEDFAAFNHQYVTLLDTHNLRVGAGDNVKATMTRTNVAPETTAAKPGQASVYAFSYVVPGSRASGQKSFVCSGSGELTGTSRDSIIALGDTSPTGLQLKARWVMQMYAARLPSLGLSWADATGINLYCVHSLTSFFEQEILNVMGSSAWLGVHWHYARPPVLDIEFEADVRGTALEEYI